MLPRFLMPSAFVLAAGFANGQTYVDLHDFGSGTDGQQTSASATYDVSNGSLYGTTVSGGAHKDGMVWEMTSAGVYKDLHDFGVGKDGIGPVAGVYVDSVGNLYGTTQHGGLYASSIDAGGMVWEITNTGVYKDLHDFGGTTDGSGPFAGVTFDSVGNMYGTAQQGGTSTHGVIWEIPKTGPYKVLHDFGSGSDGIIPDAGVTVDSAGDLFGTTDLGGLYFAGIAWEIPKGGVYKVIHNFGTTTTDGKVPYAGVTVDGAGNLYGTTYSGGRYAGSGVVFGMVWEITKAGVYKDLHDFGNGTDGAGPFAGVSFDAAGNMFGTTLDGGAAKGGMVWEIPSGGLYKDLHDFGDGKDGLTPYGDVSFDGSGNLYGTTSGGGLHGFGMVWLITPCALKQMAMVESSVTGGSPATCTVTLSSKAPVGGATVTLASNVAAATVPASIKIPGGSTYLTFTVSTIKVPATVKATIKGTLESHVLTANLTIYPPPATSISLSPTSLVGGASSTGTVTIGSAAPTGGVIVTLSSSSTSATLPASVTVKAGQTTATFTVKTTKVTSAVSATITAKSGSGTKTAILKVNP